MWMYVYVYIVDSKEFLLGLGIARVKLYSVKTSVQLNLFVSTRSKLV